jgi:hypothetical protein
MSRWSKEDRELFNNSEVFSEFEKNIMSNIVKASQILKESQDNKIKNLSEEAGKASESVKDLNKEVKNLGDSMSSLAEDDEVSDEAYGQCGFSDDETKQAMIAELNGLAKIALADKNYSDLYKIERAIQEIVDEE